MAKQQLPTNFKDDVLAAQMVGKRRYRVIQNEDGTISLEDVTNYSQIGSNFGAAQTNATNLAVNESFDKNKVIDSLADIVANEATGYAAGALAVRELNGKFEDLKSPDNYAWVALQSRTLPGSKETYLLAESLTSAVDFASATKGSAAIYIKKPGRYLIMSRINIETTSPNVLLRINRRQSAESAYTAYREIGIQKNAGEYSQMTLLTTYDTNTAFGIIIKNNSPSDCNVGESVICIIPI